MRLIDVDALGIGTAKREAFVVPEYADGWNSAIEIINNAPTIPPDSLVKRGRWIVGIDGSCMCSECRKVVRYDIENYCPRCGARLEAED